MSSASKDSDLRSLRIGHLRRRAAEALAAGNCGEAHERYSEALRLAGPAADPALRRALLANRSRAALDAGRPSDALTDANVAVAVAPAWGKAHWRRGRALGELGRWPEAAGAYALALRLTGGDGECRSALRCAVGRMTRQQVADCTLQLLFGPTCSCAGEHSSCSTAIRVLRCEQEPAAALLPAPATNNGPSGVTSITTVSTVVVDQAVSPATALWPAAAGGGVSLQAVVATDPEGRRLEGSAEWLRTEALREAAFRDVKDSGHDARSQLCRWLEADGPPLPHEASLARARLAARLHAWGPARAAAEAAAALLAGIRVSGGEEGERLLCRQLVEAHSILGDALLEGNFDSGGADSGRCVAAGVSAADAAAAARTYALALDLLPTPRTSGGGSNGSGVSAQQPDSFVKWAAAARRRIAPRLSAARAQAGGELASTGAMATGALALLPAGDSSSTVESVASGSRASRDEGKDCDAAAVILRFEWSVQQRAPAGGEPPPFDRSTVVTAVAAAAGVARRRVELLTFADGTTSDGGICADALIGFSGPGASVAAAAFANSPMAACPAKLAAAAANAGAVEAASRLQAVSSQMHLRAAVVPPTTGGDPTGWLPAGQLLASDAAAPAGSLSPTSTPKGPFSSNKTRELVPFANSTALKDPAVACAPLSAPPVLPLALPYATHRLVTASGTPLETPDKHPFALSRVHHAPNSTPPGAWIEPIGGFVRWRQTASSVEVIALRVPPGLPAVRLAVNIEPYSLTVSDRSTGEVFLSGALVRGVVPGSCVWTWGGGEGEEGCLMVLSKMNLELFERPWAHSESWWPRLFEGDADVAWDDTAKDYSDLPAEVEALRRCEEARGEAERRTAARDRATRKRLQGLEDARKRARQERLAELRRHCWEEQRAMGGRAQ